MQNKTTRFTLKLSRERIQLFLTKEVGIYEEIGSADPNKSDITQKLQALRNQVKALTGKPPIIDVMLPDELILIQNLTITSSKKQVSNAKATELVSKACELKEDEINVAVGSPTSNRTQPVAAVTRKTLDETRYFLNNAGFSTGRFMASKHINGFLLAPVFVEDSAPKRPLVDIRNAPIPLVSLVTSLFLLVGLLFFFRTFEPTEATDKLNTSILAKIPSEGITNFDESQTKKEILLSNTSPNLQTKQTLISPGMTVKSTLPSMSSTESILDQSNLKHELSTGLLTEQSVSAGGATYLISPKHNSDSNVEERYQPGASSYLQNDAEHATALRHYSKLQILKSSIQRDYLKSAHTSFAGDERGSRIMEATGLKPPKTKMEKNSQKSEKRSQPKLSLLEKIKRKFIIKKDPQVSLHNLDLAQNRKNLLEQFSSGYEKFESPTNLFIEDTLIDDLKKYGNVEINLKGFSAEETVLSNMYKPIARPKLITKINVLIEPTLSSGAVTLSQNPMDRPELVKSLSRMDPGNVKIVARATKQPSFPRRASIINNATITNIIELNRTNLIGIFGTRQNSVALIRLASGRIIKVKVGDRFYGWKVLTIHQDKIELANGKKQETLRLPG